MVYSPIAREDGNNPWAYANILAVYHVIVCTTSNPNPQTLTVLWVRWMEHSTTGLTGPNSRNYTRVSFIPWSGTPGGTFDLVDPSHIIRVSRTQVLLTKIAKLCSEIHDIKEENKSNKYSSKLPESKKKPQNSYNSAVSDTYDEHAQHAPKLYDNIPNPQNHLSYNLGTPQEHEAPLAYRLSARTPDLLNPSRTSSPNSEAPVRDPFESPEQDLRGGMSEPEPSSAERNGVETGVGLTD